MTLNSQSAVAAFVTDGAPTRQRAAELRVEGEHQPPRPTRRTTHSTLAHLDDLARRHTGFLTFADLLVGREGYLPVLLNSRNAAKRSTTTTELRELPVANDDAMANAGDWRRAIR